MYITRCFCFVSNDPPYAPATVSIAPGTILGRTELVHLGDTLLEFLVLALFVAVALVLFISQIALINLFSQGGIKVAGKARTSHFQGR